MKLSKKYLNSQEAAQLLGISIITLRRWDSSGKLKSLREGKQKHRRYSKQELLHFIANQEAPFMLAKGSNTFVFDFDSTLFPEETLDSILALALQELSIPSKELHEITYRIEAICNLGMEGKISLNESILQRLQVVDIYRKHIETYIKNSYQKFSSSIKKIVTTLQDNQQQVYVLSGGFQEWVIPLCTTLGIPTEHIFANRLIFDNSQRVSGVFTSNPLLYNNGKTEVLQQLQGSNATPGKIIMIGDGASDAEVKTAGVADWFIGYGVYKRRAKVKGLADYWINKEEQLLHYINRLIQLSS